MMKVTILVLFALFALSLAANNCAGGTVACSGPVMYTYTDGACKNQAAINNLFPSNAACITTGSAAPAIASIKQSCGTSIKVQNYFSTDCSSEEIGYGLVPTGKCILNGDGTSYKYACAGASTISASILLLVLMAIAAVFLH